jgi:formiminoglutamase
MTKKSIPQSEKRYIESVAKLFDPARTGVPTLFLKSSTDEGVIRNGGRNGARFAPQSLLSTLKRFTLVEKLEQKVFKEVEVSDQLLEQENFEKAQAEEARKIFQLISENRQSSFYHIGGGHDHIYPLLKAISGIYEKVLVVNIDAHADTRTDDAPNSGTPFRQFANEQGKNFTLIQIALNPFANSFSTLSKLETSTQDVVWRNEITKEKVAALFSTIKESVDESTACIFSVDADALSGAEVPGVSAVNPNGISLQELIEIWNSFQQIKKVHPTIIGIYELNPLYDSLASISMRTLANFIFESL